MNYFEGPPNYVPDREIRAAIEFAKRQGERRRPLLPFFSLLYNLLLRGAPRSEILCLCKRAHGELLAREGPVWGPNREQYLGSMSDEELEGFANLACKIVAVIVKEYPERLAKWQG